MFRRMQAVADAADRVPDLDPVVNDARETLSAWKTAGHTATVTLAVLAMVAVVGLIVISTWKPEEFR